MTGRTVPDRFPYSATISTYLLTLDTVAKFHAAKHPLAAHCPANLFVPPKGKQISRDL